MVWRRCGIFQRFLFENGFRDLECVGSQFTWSRGGLSQRLDRAICNEGWDLRFSNYRVRNLHRLKSDHRPILVVLDAVQVTSRRALSVFGLLDAP